MKKFAVLMVLLAVAAVAFGQGTFTIRRPVDGSTVRENVAVRIPKNSIPEGGYLGIYVNDEFIEAVMPEVDGDDYVYYLDSKARGLQDGLIKIEAVLFVDFAEAPRIVNRTSVEVNLDNRTSIVIPDEGITLRYGFRRGSEFRYNMTVRSSLAQVSQADRALGSNPPVTPLEEFNTRVLYAFDNAYEGGEGLVRLQALPDKGKDYTVVITAGATQPTLWYSYQMQPVYMRVTNTGREVWGVPTQFFGFGGQSAGLTDRLLIYSSPLPVLPSRPLRPGDTWQGTLLVSTFDPGPQQFESESFTESLPARGTFEGVEWHNGVPCAKLRIEAELGADLTPAERRNLGGLQGETETYKTELLIWFNLDKGMIERLEDRTIIETIVEVQSTGSFGGFGGGGADFGDEGEFGDEGGGFGGPDGGGRPGRRGGGGGQRDMTGWTPVVPGGSLFQFGGPAPGRPPGVGVGGFGGPGVAPGVGGFPGQNTNPRAVRQFLRLTTEQILEAER